MSDETVERLDALAACIFRGEGTTTCTIIGRRRKTPTPRLVSSARMCDRNFVEAVAMSPEKADQYFDAVAKFRRAREVFQPGEPRHGGGEHQAF